MVETDDVGVIKGIQGFLEAMYEMIRDNFPQTLHKVYFMNVNIMNKITDEWNRKNLNF